MINKVVTFLVILSALSYAANYYCDNLAPSGGNGTQTQPLQSVQQAMDMLQAGDTLFVRGDLSGGGQVYNEQLSVSVSGNASAPIVVTAFPGETVIIKYDSKFSLDESYWHFRNLIFDHNGSASDVFRWSGSYNKLTNCEVRNGSRDGIDMNGGDGNVIEYSKIHNLTNTDGIDSHGIILQDGNNNIFRHNEIFDCKGDCIQIYHGTASGTLIEHNDLYTTLGGGSENAIDFKSTVSCTVRFNKLHGFQRSSNSDGAALKVSHDADNLTIEDNDIYESNGGFRIATSSHGSPDNIIFRRNVIHDLVDGGQYSYDGYGVQFDGVNNITFQNNTLANIPGPLFWIASRGANGLDMRNNIFSDGHSFKGSTSDLQNTTISFNGWFNCSEQISGSQGDIIAADVLFSDPVNYNYTLTQNSAAVDSGDPSFGTGFPGGRIDMGAFEYNLISSIDDPQVLPGEFALSQNYPNPFNPSTTIAYHIDKPNHVILGIYDMVGKHIETLVNEYQTAGDYRYTWNADQNAQPVSSGLYVYTLTAGGRKIIRKMVLLK